jgi:hypothetical protein
MSNKTAEKKTAPVAPGQATVKLIRPNGRLVYGGYDLISIVESDAGKRQLERLDKKTASLPAGV